MKDTPMKKNLALFIALQLIFMSPAAGASDHIDGPVTTEHRVADLTDLFAFPTPKKTGFLTVILDVYTAVAANGHFSDKVNYTIYVRRASVRGCTHTGFDTSDEVALHCSFVTPRDDKAHTATCTTDGGLSATVKYNQVLPMGAADGLHLFAGQRSDPFFFNAVFAAAYSSKGKLVAPLDQDAIKGLNVLSIVIDVEVKKLFPANPPSLLALAAESTTRDSASAPVRRIDRLGRPEISNVTLVARDNDADIRDQYNAERPFAVPADHAGSYRERAAKNLAFFDQIDGHTDWTDANRRVLADVLVNDFLVVDISRPCDQPAYLEIERSIIAHTPYQSCGGRKPSDDIMDTLYTLYSGGLNGKLIRDGVDHAGRAPLNEFPWLAAPDFSRPAAIKTFLSNKALESSK